MKQRIAVMSAGLWWGSLTAIGFMAVPLLFMNLATPAMAGQMAAKLFTAQSWMSIGCALVLLLAVTHRDGAADGAATLMPVWPVLAGLLLALLIEYAVAPRIVARQNPKLWHNVGSGMYLLQWICAGIALWRVGRRT